MKDRLDQFMDDLQEKIFDEAKQVLGDQGFDRWQNPKFQGRLENFTVHAQAVGDCGDSMEIYLKIEDEQVKNASYVTNGCGSSNVCGSFAAELSIGKQADELADITGEMILTKLGNVPEDDKHCAFLAAGTVQEAVRLYYTGEKKGRKPMSQPKDTLTVQATLEITAESLKAVVKNAKAVSGADANGVFRVDTADKLGEIISKFLAEHDFENFAKDQKNYN